MSVLSRFLRDETAVSGIDASVLIGFAVVGCALQSHAIAPVVAVALDRMLDGLRTLVGEIWTV